MRGLKFLIKLAIAALIANASWQLGSVYARFYRFKDAVYQSALFGAARSEGELHERVLALASEYDLPVAADDFTIRRENDYTHIDGSTTVAVQLAPGYVRDWTLTWNIESYAAKPIRP